MCNVWVQKADGIILKEQPNSLDLDKKVHFTKYKENDLNMIFSKNGFSDFQTPLKQFLSIL